MIHYERSYEEVRAERYIDGQDYHACPPKLCGSGDGHAKGTRYWALVTCPKCKEKR